MLVDVLVDVMAAIYLWYKDWPSKDNNNTIIRYSFL